MVGSKKSPEAIGADKSLTKSTFKKKQIIVSRKNNY